MKFIICILITINIATIGTFTYKNKYIDFDDDVSDEILLKSTLDNIATGFIDNLPNHCGINYLEKNKNYEGNNNIIDFPWLGVLYYPNFDDTQRISTPVVLVTKQFVIGSATEVNRMPKNDFRARAKVILGDICTKEGVPIKDYTFHEEFNNYRNSIALIQLKNGPYMNNFFRPACPPPLALKTSEFYAITIIKGCSEGYVTFHKVEQGNYIICELTRKSAALSGRWPSSATCTLPSTRRDNEECTWTKGVPLMAYQDGRWRLFGFGSLGVGCSEPSRFLDFNIYSEWIRRSAMNIGMPAITDMGRDSVVMRMVPSHVRRYGPCDPEEVRYELYTDRIHVVMDSPHRTKKVTYNVTLFYGKEYACMVFKAYLPDRNLPRHKEQIIRPRVEIKQFTTDKKTGSVMCHQFKQRQFEFEVSMYVRTEAYLELYVYGRDSRPTNHKMLIKKRNGRVLHPFIPSKKLVDRYLGPERDWALTMKEVK